MMPLKMKVDYPNDKDGKILTLPNDAVNFKETAPDGTYISCSSIFKCPGSGTFFQ